MLVSLPNGFRNDSEDIWEQSSCRGYYTKLGVICSSCPIFYFVFDSDSVDSGLF